MNKWCHLLLASNSGVLFQICPSFGESYGTNSRVESLGLKLAYRSLAGMSRGGGGGCEGEGRGSG